MLKYWEKPLDYIEKYKLTICHNLSTHCPKWFDRGTIVPNILKDDERLINLLEYYKNSMDPPFPIDYTNYCGKLYDYTAILDSEPFKSNSNLSETLSKQILYSFLRSDQNFHYENVAFKENHNGIISMAEAIDHEFSTLFLYADEPEQIFFNSL